MLPCVAGAALAVPGVLAACGGADDIGTAALPTPGPSQGPELRAASDEKIRIGFIALTDCASVVMAQELGLFKQYGLNVELLKQASWASLRDQATETEVMVTHDIDEAILLSDRIVVMTNGPRATIREIVEVPLARPRDRRAMLHLPAYVETKERLLDLLAERAVVGAAEVA